MKKLSEMSIDELQDLLSQITDPSSAGPAQAVLESKTLMFLSNEIAVFKEALCLESKALRDSTKVVSEKLVEIVQAVGVTSDNLKKASENAEKISRVQVGQTYAMIGLTAALFLATATMACVGYKQMQEAQNLTNVSQQQANLIQKQTQIMYADYVFKKSNGTVEAVLP